MSQRIQLVTAAKKNICLRIRMMIVAHNSKGSLITIWIGGLTPLEEIQGGVSYTEDPKIVQEMTKIMPGFQGEIPANSRKGIPYVGGKVYQVAKIESLLGKRLSGSTRYSRHPTMLQASNYDDLLYYQELCRVHNAAEFSTDIGSELEEATRNHSLLDGYHLQPSFRRWYHSIEYHCRGHQTFRRGCGISSHGEPF
ncbi:hypothetical protein AAG906_029063 [Vitis piasezkii]